MDLVKIIGSKVPSYVLVVSLAQPAQNRSVIIEFKIDDVEKDYERLADYHQNYIVQNQQ